jgi:hypothetical protein
METATVSGLPSVLVDYAYVADPLLGAGAGTIPVVARALDVLVLHEGTLYVVTLAADADRYEAESAAWDRIRSSLRVGGR